MIIDNIKQCLKNLSSMIGNTPMLEISFQYKGEERVIYAKAEYYNLTGSIKDRMALYVLEKAYEKGSLEPGQRIIEATSGNTGISFSALGRILGHEVTIFMPEWMSEERKNLIRSYGAEVELVSSSQGGFLGSIALSEELARRERGFLPCQFSNEDNCTAHYLTTGPEIWWQLQVRGITPAAVVAGVGTGGTIMGFGRFLKEKNPDVKLHPLEPSNSPTLSMGHKIGKHRIQGISDEFIPPIIKLTELDEIISVDDGDAIIMSQKLASVLGLGVGISSGANFIGAIKAQNLLGGKGAVVTIFSDDNKKYLSTGLMKPEPVKEGFISTDVVLTGVKAFKRACYTCCKPEECKGLKFPCAMPACPGRYCRNSL